MTIAALREEPSSDALAREAYETLAPFYDEFTSDFAHEVWLSELESWAREEGLRGRRLLDVGCGTGKSFAPMIAKGYDVSACDISPGMLRLARQKADAGADIRVADMRCLPWVDRFDLLTCLDDGINHLLTHGDLGRTLESMVRALKPGGLAVFDANTLNTYRSTFAQEFEVFRDDVRFLWRGSETRLFARAGTARATLQVFHGVRTFRSEHVERHWPIEVIDEACRAAGFASAIFRGQVTGARLVDEPDELRHSKFLCLAQKTT